MIIQTMPYPGTVAGPSATYWRLRFPAGSFDTQFNYLTLSEIEMRATEGGADQCTGGTATASSTGPGGNPSYAFDNNNTTVWLTSSGGAANSWIRYQFAAPVSVAEVKLRADASAYKEAPRGFVLEYSNDGTTWTTHFSQTCYAWNASEEKVFKASTPYTEAGHRFWRFRFTNGSGGGYIALTEAEFRDSGGTDRSSTTNIVDSGWNNAVTVFNNTLDTSEAYPPNGQAVNSWIGCQLTNSYDITSVWLRNCGDAGEYPRATAVEYSDDLVTWTTSWTFTANSGNFATTTSTRP